MGNAQKGRADDGRRRAAITERREKYAQKPAPAAHLLTAPAWEGPEQRTNALERAGWLNAGRSAVAAL